MPIDYKKYPANWKTEIRPDILKRAGNKCEFCKIPDRIWIIRGHWNEKEAYQDDNGKIYDADTSEQIGEDYLGEVDPECKNPLVKVVLTVAHLDHNIENNDYSNLKALCQKCHNRYDKEHRKKTRDKKKSIGLFTDL